MPRCSWSPGSWPPACTGSPPMIDLRARLAAAGPGAGAGLLLGAERTRSPERLYAGPGRGVLRARRRHSMNVAILGTRGIPAAYSGFETAVEQITSRLTARGHEVTVYCRPHVVDPGIREWKGARLVHLPTARNKYLDTFVHTLLSSVHAARGTKPDVALFFIAGNSPLCLVTRLAGHPDGDQRGRVGLRPAQVGPLRQVLPARRRAPGADGWPRARSPTLTPWRACTSSATAARSGWCPTGPRCPSTTTPTCWSAWASSRGATCCSSVGWSPRTTPTCWWRPGRAFPPRPPGA